MRTSLTVAVLLAALGCAGSDGAPASTTAPKLGQSTARPASCYGFAGMCPSFPTTGPNVLTGVVVLRTPAGILPVGSIEMRPIVRTAGSAYEHTVVLTDGTGHFRIDSLPNGSIELFAGAHQPCVTVVPLTGSGATVTLELTWPASPAYATEAPVVSGTVFERTPNGRAPVAGAVIVLWGGAMESMIASTATDAQGRFALCRVPQGESLLNVLQSGTNQLVALPITIPGDTVLDIEVHR